MIQKFGGASATAIEPFVVDLYRMMDYQYLMFCFVLFCFVLFCFVLFCFILFYFILFYLSSIIFDLDRYNHPSIVQWEVCDFHIHLIFPYLPFLYYVPPFPSPLPPSSSSPFLPFPLSPFSLSSYLIFLYIGFQRRRLRGSLQCNSSHTNRTGPRPFSTRRHQFRRACERIGIR